MCSVQVVPSSVWSISWCFLFSENPVLIYSFLRGVHSLTWVFARHVINVMRVEKRNFTTVAVGSSFIISLGLYQSIQSIKNGEVVADMPVMGLILHVSKVCVLLVCWSLSGSVV